MKLGKYTFPSILGASVLAGGLYFAIDSEPKHKGVKILTHKVAHRTQNTISPFGDTKIYGIPLETSIPINNPQTKDSIDELLQKNPTLRQRIQGTIWYRDFISGRLDKLTAERYIIDAQAIEEILKQNPGVIDGIQYEAWWQRYIQGETNPTDMLTGNIVAYLQIQQIQEKNPGNYEKAKTSPLWNTGIHYGKDYVVVGQREILTSLLLRRNFLDTHPDIERRLNEKGFTRDNLFTDDWSRGEGIYGAMNAMQDEEIQ